MQVIPVIDLKAGCVVHARQGARDRYAPIETPLCRGSAPLDVVAGLLALHPFTRLYVADLDAIAGGEGHGAAIAAIAAQWPGLEIWVDAGVATVARAQAWLARRSVHVVLGSESQTDAAVLSALAAEQRVLLSLDFRGDDFCGPRRVLEDAACWPDRVIVMTLARVGAQSGPDFPRVHAIAARAGRRGVYAAGGVRDAPDLAALADAGAAGVLVATALHTGAITAADLLALSG